MRFDKEYHEYLQGNCPNYGQSLVCALEEMEKGGEKNMRDDDGRCANCGGIRVEGSTLCVDCLIATVNSYAMDINVAEEKIEELKEKNRKLTRLCERLLDHITNQVIHTGEIERWMAGAGKIVKKEGKAKV